MSNTLIEKKLQTVGLTSDEKLQIVGLTIREKLQKLKNKKYVEKFNAAFQRNLWYIKF